MIWSKLGNLVALLVSTAWLSRQPDWEPLLAFIGFLGGIVAQERVWPRSKATRKRGAELHPCWDKTRLYNSLVEVPPYSEVRFMNTFFADVVELIPTLERLLKSEKAFKLRILLLDWESEIDLATARSKLRLENREDIVGHVKSQVHQFQRLKDRIDKDWSTTRNGAKLDMQIRLYDHIPCGVLYQVGDSVMFMGFLLSDSSSIHGPMLEIRSAESREWTIFRQDFEAAWSGSRQVFPTPKTACGTSNQLTL